MSAAVNRRVVLAARPVGVPKLADFGFAQESLPEPADGEFLLQAHYLSADPLQRWRMEESTDYGNTIALGETVWGRMVGQVVRSRHPDWREGDFAEGMLGWQEYALSRGDTAKARYARGVTRVDPSLAPVSTALGVLGMPGLTAYFALLEICRPQAGETVVVSAAAGTVGSLAGQIAKLRGCRVVGIVGSREKARHIVEDLGFDAAIDYRATPDLAAALRAACPDRIDAYFDNVGGSVADAAYRHLAPRARIAVVGRVSQLGGTATRQDPQEFIIAARARIEGFLVYDYENRAGESRAAISQWLSAGRIRFHETVHQGIESAPQALIDVLRGKGIGKHVIRLGSERE
jgi:NADPH-dependent curcumin reductase CurA